MGARELPHASLTSRNTPLGIDVTVLISKNNFEKAPKIVTLAKRRGWTCVNVTWAKACITAGTEVATAHHMLDLNTVMSHVQIISVSSSNLCDGL